MDRITPEAVVAAAKKLGLKSARVGWYGRISRAGIEGCTKCCCGAGMLVADKLGGYKEMVQGFSSPRAEDCFGWVADTLGLNTSYLESFTRGFDGTGVLPEEGAGQAFQDGAAVYKALQAEGIMVEGPYLTEDDAEDENE